MFLEKTHEGRFVIGRTDPKILKRLIKRMETRDKQNCLLIHDEVHGLGSAEKMAALVGHTNDFKFALGLSATLKRYDDDETAFIAGEFGGNPEASYEYGLEEAIQDGYLVEFDYEFVEYERNAEDGAAFQKRMANPGMPWMFEGVYKSSLAKVDAFKDWSRRNQINSKVASIMCILLQRQKTGHGSGRVFARK